MNVDQVCGLQVEALEDGRVALEALVILKALDEDGDIVYTFRATEGLSAVEAVGMTTYAGDALRGSCQCCEDDEE